MMQVQNETAYLNSTWQSLEDSLLLCVYEEGLAILLHSCKDVGACRIPRKKEECALFELCGGSCFACPDIPNPDKERNGHNVVQ